jgi:nitrogen fixation/metabolism regulation signal transduction histidine kinase
MGFNDFRYKITVRVLLIAFTIFFFTHLLYNDAFFVTLILVLVLIIFQISSLIKFLDQSNQEIASFFNSIKHNDFSQNYQYDEDGTYIDILKKEFNMVMQKLSQYRAERDANYQYLKNIVQHVGIGLITFKKDGEIQIINTAAKKLFHIDQIENIRELEKLSSELVSIFFELKTGGRSLMKIDFNGDVDQLSIYAIELTLQGELFKLISVQNIRTELEENEMEAWQKLVRVLTHEIMNSVTPISSLANTIECDLEECMQRQPDSENLQIEKENLSDMHLGIKTIQRRSDALLRFVSDFRSLTQIPKPILRDVPVKEIFEHVSYLMKQELESNRIRIICSLEPEDIVLNIDPELIQQVLINLVKNSVQALLEEDHERLIEMKAYLDEKNNGVIMVRDNGQGIEEEAQTKIFIPFFTTKKKGSGIGLSLSRQIMRQHLGSISVKSKIDEGTEFTLRF